ncbi:hypothetical protein E3N88_12910 [Mikania micrantha]|uniref:Uncharacterized protein n=1 Tax=Mikania micrantha TaxID=192012 RepID=A0A5N6P6X3_9ASTR|nr:hypothetical protein E3N88_12910 [Mikania micrantha]
MKLDLLGSAETHRGTRWTYNWAFAVREAQAGEFEFSKKTSRYATTDHLQPSREALGSPPTNSILHISTRRLHQQVLELLTINLRPHPTDLKTTKVVLCPILLKTLTRHTCKPFRLHASPPPPISRNFDVICMLFDDLLTDLMIL